MYDTLHALSKIWFRYEEKHASVIMTNVYKIGEEMKANGYIMKVVIHITAFLS